MNKYDSLLDKVEKYYTNKLHTFGATSKGVDWNTTESQEIRFQQLLKVCTSYNDSFSINDYGCGYGYLFEYISAMTKSFDYFGFDVSESMVTKAIELYAAYPNCHFYTASTPNKTADYSVASGIFNVKFENDYANWQEYILTILQDMDRHSRQGFAFNFLTKYSDKEFMRDDLYYADPCFFFDYCKRNFSGNIALLHDYKLYEFTIIVRKA